MRLLIDREARTALYDACRSEIEAVSDLVIDESVRDATRVRHLWRVLRTVGPLLDQIGWEPEVDRDTLNVALNARAMRAFLRHRIRDTMRMLEDNVVTEKELNEELAYRTKEGPRPPTAEERARALRAMRRDVDDILDKASALRRVLDALGQQPPVPTSIGGE